MRFTRRANCSLTIKASLRSCHGKTGDLGAGIKAAEAGQSENRDDKATGSKQLRDAFYRHLEPEDVPLNRRGLEGMMTQVMEKLPPRFKGKK